MKNRFKVKHRTKYKNKKDIVFKKKLSLGFVLFSIL